MSWLRALYRWLLFRRINAAIDDAARKADWYNPPGPHPDNVVHLPRREGRR